MAKAKAKVSTNGLDAVTSSAVNEFTAVAEQAATQAKSIASSMAVQQAELDQALAQAQAANGHIAALGGSPVDLSGLGVSAPKGKRGRKPGSGKASTGGQKRPRNPYDLPTSIMIAMAGSRVGTEFNNDAVREALETGGYKTSAKETSFRTQITQNLSKLVNNEFAPAIPKGSVTQVSRGVYALTATGKNAIKGYSLSDNPDAEETE